MALTTCAACNGKVSDQAKACPHCGHPVHAMGGTCPDCSGPLPANASSCPSCGRPSSGAGPEGQGPTSGIRILFPSPGWFLFDGSVEVLLDGLPIHRGSFIQGFDVHAPAEPGSHQITVVLKMAVGRCNRSYSVEVAPGSVRRVKLGFSRCWGNFSNSLEDLGNGGL